MWKLRLVLRSLSTANNSFICMLKIHRPETIWWRVSWYLCDGKLYLPADTELPSVNNALSTEHLITSLLTHCWSNKVNNAAAVHRLSVSFYTRTPSINLLHGLWSNYWKNAFCSRSESWSSSIAYTFSFRVIFANSPSYFL